MKRKRKWKKAFWPSVLLVAAAAASAQIIVEGTPAAYNQFDSSPGGSVSGQMSNTGDLFVQSDIELGGELYIDEELFMQRDEAAPSLDQVIFFADDLLRSDESFRWDDSEDLFSFSDDVGLIGNRVLEATSELSLFAEAPTMRFVVDSDDTTATAATDHNFIWYLDSTNSGDRVMLLRSDSSDDGDLFIDGQLTQNTSFDLAESFWKSEPLEPGELVAIDPDRSDAVRRSAGAGDRLVIGVVSTRPAIVMGGGAFSAHDLRRAWGDQVADAFEQERSNLEALIYAEREGLRAERDDLYSVATYRASQSVMDAERAPAPLASDENEDEDEALPLAASGALSEREAAEDHARALFSHQERVFDQVMQRFFELRFASVAMAGRVPVKADASFGAIEPGDRLTASHLPGVAMKATGAGPIIGTALESLTAGEGRIMTLVHLGWQTGGADAELLALRGQNRHKDAELAELRRANDDLERRLESLELLVQKMAAAPPAPKIAMAAPR